MSLDGATTQLQAYALSVNGINSAPDDPQESMNFLPFAVSYPATGTIERQDGSFSKNISVIFTEIHVSRTLLPKAVELTKTFLDAYGQLLIDNPTIGDTVSTIVYPVRWTFGNLPWGDDTNLGIRFEIDVKLLGTVT